MSCHLLLYGKATLGIWIPSKDSTQLCGNAEEVCGYRWRTTFLHSITEAPGPIHNSIRHTEMFSSLINVLYVSICKAFSNGFICVKNRHGKQTITGKCKVGEWLSRQRLCQAWWSDFSPWIPPGWGREGALTSCPLTSTRGRGMCICAHHFKRDFALSNRRLEWGLEFWVRWLQT